MHAVNELILLYNELDDTDFYKNAAALVLKNLEAVPVSSTYELAELCYVSPATILRLSRRLGYESYTDFKLSVSMDLKEVRDNIFFTYEELQWDKNFLSQGIDAICHTLKKVQEDVPDEYIIQAAKMFHQADQIAFFTATGSSYLRNFQMRLTLSGKEVCVLKTSKAQDEHITKMNSKTLVCIIELIHSNQYKDKLAKLKKSGASAIYISNCHMQNNIENIDLSIGFHGSSFRRDSMGIETILAAISIAYTNQENNL